MAYSFSAIQEKRADEKMKEINQSNQQYQYADNSGDPSQNINTAFYSTATGLLYNGQQRQAPLYSYSRAWKIVFPSN